MSCNKYRAIIPPVSFRDDNAAEVYLGKSEKGVYIASYGHPDDLLQVWVLDESCGQMEWFLKHNCDLKHVLRQNCYLQASGPWVLQDVNYNVYRDHIFQTGIKQAPVEEKYEVFTSIFPHDVDAYK